MSSQPLSWYWWNENSFVRFLILYFIFDENSFCQILSNSRVHEYIMFEWKEGIVFQRTWHDLKWITHVHKRWQNLETIPKFYKIVKGKTVFKMFDWTFSILRSSSEWLNLHEPTVLFWLRDASSHGVKSKMEWLDLLVQFWIDRKRSVKHFKNSFTFYYFIFFYRRNVHTYPKVLFIFYEISVVSCPHSNSSFGR